MNSPYKYFLLCLFCFVSILLTGQSNKHTLSGYVKDSLTQESLIGATIYNVSNGQAVISNKFGYFNIQLQGHETVLEISYIGYKKKTITVSTPYPQSIFVKLEEGLQIDEVQVYSSLKKNTEQAELGTVRIPMQQIKSMPALFGEADIMHTLQQIPGVQSGGEGKSDLNVRGGTGDQNLVLLDDIPLYNVSHFGGFISTFNSESIADVTFHKGGFPARYNGRLSSVIDVRSRNGNMSEYKVSGMLGMLTSKLLVEGPVIKNKLSFLTSFRINTLPIFKMVFEEPLAYNFYDYNFKANYIASPKSRIFASFFMNNDKVQVKQEASVNEYSSSIKNYTKWGNRGASVKWNYTPHQKLFINTTLAYTNYNLSNGFNKLLSGTTQQNVDNTFNSRVDDFILKIEPEYYIHPNWTVRAGYISTKHFFEPGTIQYHQSGSEINSIDNTYRNPTVKAWENSVYAENKLQLWGFFLANIGVHFSNYKISSKESFNSLEPRIVTNFRFTQNISFKAAYTQMKQYVHQLTFSGTGMPTDYWMPSTNYAPPQEATQYSIGFDLDIFDNQLSLSIEAYNKYLKNLISFKQGESMFAVNESWQEKIEVKGIGNSKGLEVFLQKQSGATTGWIGLTLSKSVREFTNINNGSPYPFKYDSPISINIVLTHRFSEKISLSSSWNFYSGYPVTIPTEKYNTGQDEVWIFSEKKSFRMENYHRLDFGINFYKKTRWGERTWNISLYNAYNRKNPYYYYFDNELQQVTRTVAYEGGGTGIEVYNEIGPLKLYKQSLFSIFPSFAYIFKF